MRSFPRLTFIGACLAAAALPLGFVAPAQAGEPVLVSNINQTDSNSVGLGANYYAQGFTTGKNTEGYTLGSVELEPVQNLPETKSAVQIMVLSSNNSGEPDQTSPALCTLVNPSDQVLGTFDDWKFTAPTVNPCPSLDPETTYFVRMAYNISADTILNDAGESFYRILVRTRTNHLGTIADPLPIIPGMIAEVDIMTGSKTVLDYILNPINRARERALSER